jgi:hypothetical protein
VALDAVRGDQTLAALLTKHGIHPTMIATRQAAGDRRHGRSLLGRKRGGEGHGRLRDRDAARQIRATGGKAAYLVEGVRAMHVAHPRQMIERKHSRLSIVAQCRSVSISRSSLYHALMTAIDAAFLAHPC